MCVHTNLAKRIVWVMRYQVLSRLCLGDQISSRFSSNSNRRVADYFIRFCFNRNVRHRDWRIDVRLLLANTDRCALELEISAGLTSHTRKIGMFDLGNQSIRCAGEYYFFLSNRNKIFHTVSILTLSHWTDNFKLAFVSAIPGHFVGTPYVWFP